MRVYEVVLDYPYEGTRSLGVYTNKQAAAALLKALNRYDPQSYGEYYMLDYEPEESSDEAVHKLEGGGSYIDIL